MGVFGDLFLGNYGLGIQKSIADAQKKKLEAERQQKLALERLKAQSEEQLRNALINSALNLYERGITAGVPTENLSGLSDLLSQGFAGTLTPEVFKQATQSLLPGFQTAREREDQKKEREKFQRLAEALIDKVDPNRVDDYEQAVNECKNSQDPWSCFAAKAPQFNLDSRIIRNQSAKLGIESQKLDNALKKQKVQIGEIELQYLPKEKQVALDNAKKQGILTDEEIALKKQEWQQRADKHYWDMQLLQQNVEYRKLVNQEKALELQIMTATAPDQIAKLHEELKQTRLKTKEMELRNKSVELDNEIKAIGVEDAKLASELKKALVPAQLMSSITDLERIDPRAALSLLDNMYDDLIKNGADEKTLKEYRDALERRARVSDPERTDGYQLWRELAASPPPKDINAKLQEVDEYLKSKGYNDQERREMLSVLQMRWQGLLDEQALKAYELQMRYRGTTNGSADSVIKAIDADRKVLLARQNAAVSKINAILSTTGAKDCVRINWDTYTLMLADDTQRCQKALNKVGGELNKSLGDLRDINDQLYRLSTISSQLSGRNKTITENDAKNFFGSAVLEYLTANPNATEEEVAAYLRQRAKGSPYEKFASKYTSPNAIRLAITNIRKRLVSPEQINHVKNVVEQNPPSDLRFNNGQ